jgi:hypothetical protein
MTKTASGKRTKLNSEKPQNQKEEKKMPTIDPDEILLDEGEDFKLPTPGVHNANLSGVELVATKKNENKDQIVLTIALSSEDHDAPNLPMRKYLGWPLPEEKEVMWGSRTAFGAQIQSIKEALTAFGGQESGGVNKQKVVAFFDSKIGMACKVKVKQEYRTDPITKEPVEPKEFQASVDKILPA